MLIASSSSTASFDCCLGDAKPAVQPEDGRIALVLAEAAVESVKRGGPVKL